MDAYYLGRPNSSVGIFQRNMIAQFSKNGGIDELHILTNAEPDNDLRYVNCYYHISRGPFIQKGLYMAKLEDTIRPDIVFYTFNLIPPMDGLSRTRKVLQNHDWSHGQFATEMGEKIRGHIYQILHKRSSLSANLNLANSQFTSEETLKYTGKNCSVIYHDADPIYKSRVPSETENQIHRKLKQFNYIIYAGRVGPIYKNMRSLLLAFKNISNKFKNLKLVIVHSDTFNSDDEDLIRKLGSSVISIRNVSKLELKYLYKNSACMVYPSLYEGFGSPILEAQNSGTPVIAYDRKPMTEVGGEGAVYFNGRISSLMEKIEIFIEDSTARKNTIIKGFNNAKRFDWKATAEKTFEAFNEQ